MPKPNKIECEIERLYRRSAFHHMFFGFVNGVIWTTPSISRAEAIRAFIKRFNIDNDYDQEDLQATYCRIEKDFNDSQKTKA